MNYNLENPLYRKSWTILPNYLLTVSSPGEFTSSLALTNGHWMIQICINVQFYGFTLKNGNLVQLIKFISQSCTVCMYVRVGLYFLDIILDIALIQCLPKWEKDCPRTCSRWVVEEKKRKKVFMESAGLISNNLTLSLLSFQCLLELKILTTEWTSKH